MCKLHQIKPANNCPVDSKMDNDIVPKRREGICKRCGEGMLGKATRPVRWAYRGQGERLGRSTPSTSSCVFSLSCVYKDFFLFLLRGLIFSSSIFSLSLLIIIIRLLIKTNNTIIIVVTFTLALSKRQALLPHHI